MKAESEVTMSQESIHALNKHNFSSFTPRKEVPAEIYWFRVTGTDYSVYQTHRMHHHTFFELHFCHEGSFSYDIDGKVHRMKGNVGILIAPHTSHAIYCPEPYSKLSLAFSVQEDSPLYTALLAFSNRVFDIAESTLKDIEFVLEEMKRDTEYSGTLAYARLLSLICGLAELPRRSREAKEPRDSRHDERLFKAKCYITDNIDAFLTCADVAAYCHISTKQLKRLFLQHENCTLLGYIHQKKKEAAERLVSETDLPFSDISEQLGFSSVAYFHRFFTEHTGMTPGDYRRTNCT